MKETLIRDIESRLTKKFKDNTIVEIVIEELTELLKNIDFITWSIDDIHHICEENEITLSDNDAIEVLTTVMTDHAVETGINWDFIKETIDNMVEQEFIINIKSDDNP